MKQITHKHSRDEVSSSVDTNGTVHDSLEKTHPNEEPSININILTRKILMCQISDIRAKICVNSNYSLSPFIISHTFLPDISDTDEEHLKWT